MMGHRFCRAWGRRRERHVECDRRISTRLHRDPANGVFLGVCAGIADYFDISVSVVRALTIIGTVFFFPGVPIAYIAAGVFLKRAPEPSFESPEDETFWRKMRTEPTGTFSSLRHRYRALEQRLRALETYATSREFRLSKEIDDLK